MSSDIYDIDEFSSTNSITEFSGDSDIRSPSNLTRLDTLECAIQSDFAVIYKSLYPFAFFLARRFVSPEDANDIVANVFANLWKRKGELGKILNPKAFLSTSVRNACLGHIRNESSRALKEAGWHYLSYGREAVTDGYKEEIAAEKLELIYAEMKKLPARCRMVFQMYYLQNLKNDQIAKLMGITVLTVKTQKSNALKALRMALISICPFLILLW